MSTQRNALLLTSCFLFLALHVQGQVTFSVGPHVGLNVATARYAPDERYVSYGVITTSNAGYRPGVEVGAVGTIGFGHFVVQPSVLYSQKGFSVQGTQSDVQATDGTIPAPYEITNRLSYLTLPVNIAYAQRKNGQGFRVFAGPYLGIFVAGDYRFKRPSTTLVVEYSGAIKAGTRPADFDPFTDPTIFSQRVDAGLQVGGGYQWRHLLLQATYSLGLRNLAPSDYAQHPYLGNGPDFSNRVLQISLAYLFSLKS